MSLLLHALIIAQVLQLLLVPVTLIVLSNRKK